MTPGLIERLEAAGEWSRELDAEIAVWSAYRGAVRIVDAREESIFRHQPGWCRDANDISILAPNYTTSLDAALALAERVLPGWEFGTYISRPDVHGNRQTKIEARRWQDVAPEYAFACASSSARTPALALCIAILKARATQGQTHG